MYVIFHISILLFEKLIYSKTKKSHTSDTSGETHDVFNRFGTSYDDIDCRVRNSCIRYCSIS